MYEQNNHLGGGHFGAVINTVGVCRFGGVTGGDKFKSQKVRSSFSDPFLASNLKVTRKQVCKSYKIFT